MLLLSKTQNVHLNNTEARLSVPQPSRDPYRTTPAVAATVWHRLPSRGQSNQDDSVEASKHLPDMFGQKQRCNIHYRLYMWSVGSHGYTEHTKDNKLSMLVVFRKDGSGLNEGKHRKHLMGTLNTARSRCSELFMRKTFLLV